MNRRIKIASIIAILIFLVYLTLHLAIPAESNVLWPTVDSILIVLGLMAGITAILTAKSLGWKSKESKVWLLLGVGYLGWAIGEFLWVFNEDILGIAPFPSTADVFYLAAYVPIIIGLWTEFRIIKEAVNAQDILKAVGITLLAAIASTALVIGPVIVATDYELLSKIVSLLYPVGDIILLLPALVFLFVFKGAKMSRSWLLVSLATIIMAVADTAFAYLEWNEIEALIPWILANLGWAADYILFALAAYYHTIIMQGET